MEWRRPRVTLFFNARGLARQREGREQGSLLEQEQEGRLLLVDESNAKISAAHELPRQVNPRLIKDAFADPLFVRRRARQLVVLLLSLRNQTHLNGIHVKALDIREAAFEIPDQRANETEGGSEDGAEGGEMRRGEGEEGEVAV